MEGQLAGLRHGQENGFLKVRSQIDQGVHLSQVLWTNAPSPGKASKGSWPLGGHGPLEEVGHGEWLTKGSWRTLGHPFPARRKEGNFQAPPNSGEGDLETELVGLHAETSAVCRLN
jgi:hypothetical protein